MKNYTKKAGILLLIITLQFCLTIAQKDHGEACKLRSQIASLITRSESHEGCNTSKGLVCFNHKCICMDPTNVYELPTEDPPSSSSSSAASSIASSVIGFIKGDKNKNQPAATETSTIASAATQGKGGKCVGRAGSPCFTQNSTCVKHAVCEGNPRLCKCQGIYASNAQGYCSKTASVITQVVKHVGK